MRWAAAVFMMLFWTAIACAADWYWRPANSDPTKICRHAVCDGTSYETAWRLTSYRLGINPGAVDLSQMDDGDTLYLCGTHSWPNFDNRLLIDRGHITISGQCPSDPGTLQGRITVRDADHVTLADLKFDGDVNSQAILFQRSSYSTVRNVHIENFRTGIECQKSIAGRCDAIHILDSTIRRVGQGILSSNYSGNENNGWIIRGNVIEYVGWDDRWPGVDYEAIGLQGGQQHRVANNRIRFAAYGINVWSCEQHHLTDIHILNNRLAHIQGGHPMISNWPSRAIMRSCFREVDGHDQHLILNNSIQNVDAEGIRWACAKNATACVIQGNDLAITGGIKALGAITEKENVSIP